MSVIAEALKEAKRIELVLELDFNGFKLGLAERDISVPYAGGGAKHFRGLIRSPLSTGAAFDLSSFTYSQQSLGVNLVNKNRFQDYEIKTQLDGGRGTLYIWCDGLNWSDIEDDGVLFRGVFRKNYHTLNEYDFTLYEEPYAKFLSLPRTTINVSTWPQHRTEGGQGSVAGLSQAMIFGDWPKGIPLKCVHTSNYMYLAGIGPVKSADADYTAATENVYDKDGATIAAAGYTFYPDGIDGEGNLVATFDFTGDQAAKEPLSCSIRGLHDPSGLVTGTADALIEHPADIVYYLLFSHTELVPDDIDIESLRTFRSVLSGAKFATIVNRAVEGSALFERLLTQCHCARLKRGRRVGIMVFDTDAPVTSRSRRFDQLGRSVTIRRSPADMICNDLLVKYALNPTTSQWEGELIYDRTNDPRCERSYYDYGPQSRYTFELPDVQDEGTAKMLASRRLDIFSQRHDLIERSVPIWQGWDVQEGDVAEIEVAEGASIDRAGWSAEKCILLDRIFENGIIRQKWWRVAT